MITSENETTAGVGSPDPPATAWVGRRRPAPVQSPLLGPVATPAAATEPFPTKARIDTAAAAGLAFTAAVALWLTYGDRWVVLALVPWASGLGALAITDLRDHHLSRRTVYITGAATAAALTIVAIATATWDLLGTGALCAASVTVVLSGAWIASPRSIGFGDVRLAALCALMLGWLAPVLVIAALGAAQVCCLAVIAVLFAAKRVNRHTEIPLGTFIALASIITAVVYGR